MWLKMLSLVSCILFFASLGGSLHYAGQVERLFKLVTREGRSSLKYIMSVLLLDFVYFIEKSFTSRLEFGFPFLVDPTLGVKSAKKCCYIRIVEAFYLWSLATIVV